MITLDETIIAAYLRGELEPDERARVEAALDRQPEWLAVVAVMAREHDLEITAAGPTIKSPSTGSGDDEALGERAALAPGTRVGRFEIRRRLATGGMGVVHEAWDATLQRPVALKIARRRPRDAQARERQLREARTLAQLSAPNVVSVFDAGEHDGRMYLAMEKLEGPTLRAHLARARLGAGPTLAVAEIVGLFIEAARGLHAAHRKGIVHRDFKPDNVIVEGERVVVVDFGLALPPAGERETLEALDERERDPTQTDTVAGTPAYMAPEQRRGETVTARSDQYSLCVALAEALDDAELRIPARLRAVLERGRSEQPERRFDGLGRLLAALERAVAPPRRLVRGLLAGGVTTLAFAVGVVGSWASDAPAAVVAPADPCAAARVEIEQTWNQDARAQLEARLRSFDKPYLDALAGLLTRAVDARARAWTRARHELCVSHELGRISSEGHELRAACLDRRRDELELFLQLDWERGDEASAARSFAALSELSPASVCEDLEALRAQSPVPDQPDARARVEALRHGLAELELLHQARRLDQAQALARELLTEAKALGYEPVIAELESEFGWILVTAGDHEDAEAELDSALLHAEASGHDRLIAQLWVRKLWSLGHIQAQIERGDEAEAHARAWLRRVGEPAELSFDYQIHLGWFAHTSGDDRRAIAAFERALSLADEPFTRALAHNGLGSAALGISDMDRAAEHLRRAMEVSAGLLGEDHPDVAKARNNLAGVLRVLGEYEESARYFERNLAAFAGVYGPDHELVGQTELNLAILAMDQGRYQDGYDHADSASTKLAAALGEDHPFVSQARESKADALLHLDRVDEGVALLREVIAAQIRSLGPDHPALASSYHNLGIGLADAGRLEQAIVEYERARELLEGGKGEDHYELATVLVNLGLAHEGLDHLRAAEASYRHAVELAAPMNEPEARSRLGRLLVDEGQREAGREQLERALAGYRELDGHSVFLAQTAYALARVLWTGSAEDRGRALELAREASTAYAEGGDHESAAEARAWVEARGR